jgi:hypothetical protein
MFTAKKTAPQLLRDNIKGINTRVTLLNGNRRNYVFF